MHQMNIGTQKVKPVVNIKFSYRTKLKTNLLFNLLFYNLLFKETKKAFLVACQVGQCEDSLGLRCNGTGVCSCETEFYFDSTCSKLNIIEKQKKSAVYF